MARFGNIVEINGRIVDLDKMQNSRLPQILRQRISSSKFSFFHRDEPGYRESKGYDDWSEKYSDYSDTIHQDAHNDRHTDKQYWDHNDNYSDESGGSSSSSHTDKGYSEHTDYKIKR